ncbi:IPT/TIG domain-containing protein [Pedobacter antarcticus]|uniref:IPT/TIG domain-containing protein n=1 Tax=Pedobacter antarcticus TaxID=34086 RepID=UPI00292E463D|nr:IPT/TIG domain-containing protein [Pedobacter antarcticus]
MKKSLAYIFLVLALGSCKKEPKSTIDPNTLPTITVIKNQNDALVTNTLGKPNQFITLIGHHFSQDFKESKVLFGTVNAIPVSGDSTTLRVAIPDDALVGQLKLTLITNGQTIVHPTPYFIVEPPAPQITGLSSIAGMAGSQLIIYGTDFSTNAAKTTVNIGKQTATVDQTSMTEIRVTLPNPAVVGKLTLKTHGVTLTHTQDIQTLSSTFSLFSQGAHYSPRYLSTDAAGNIYGTVDNTVVKITPEGRSSVLATIGTWGDAKTQLAGCVADPTGNVYVSSPYDLSASRNQYSVTSSKIFKITPGGDIRLMAGDYQGHQDGNGNGARFNYPGILTIDRTGNLYVYDWGRIRKISPAGQVTTLVEQILPTVTAMAVEPKTGKLYIIEAIDYNYNSLQLTGRIRVIAPNGIVSTPAITPAPEAIYGSLFPDISRLKSLGTSFAFGPSGILLAVVGSHIYELKNGALKETFLNPTAGVVIASTFDASGKLYLSAPANPDNYAVYKVNP